MQGRRGRQQQHMDCSILFRVTLYNYEENCLFIYIGVLHIVCLLDTLIFSSKINSIINISNSNERLYFSEHDVNTNFTNLKLFVINCIHIII